MHASARSGTCLRTWWARARASAGRCTAGSCRRSGLRRMEARGSPPGRPSLLPPHRSQRRPHRCRPPCNPRRRLPEHVNPRGTRWPLSISLNLSASFLPAGLLQPRLVMNPSPVSGRACWRRRLYRTTHAQCNSRTIALARCNRNGCSNRTVKPDMTYGARRSATPMTLSR